MPPALAASPRSRSVLFTILVLMAGLALAAAGCGEDETPAPTPARADAASERTASPDMSDAGAEPDLAPPTEDAAPTEDDAAEDSAPQAMPDAGAVEVDASVSVDAAVAIDVAVEAVPVDAAALDVQQPAPDTAIAETAIDAAAAEGSGDGSADPDPAGCEGAGCPPRVAPGHLQLWLRGDVGVVCAPGAAPRRVQQWTDHSGGGRHALPATGKVGPTCGTGITVGGRQVVVFPATGGFDGEEHLEVDMSALAGKPFTVAVVERREPRVASFFLGSRLKYPDAVSCSSNINAGRGLLMGYAIPQLMTAGTWGSGCDITAPVVAGGTGVRVSVLTFAPGAGLTLHVDGSKAGQAASVGLLGIEKGLIGRGYDLSASAHDSRYHGVIAEIAAFDVALGDSERAMLESYLKGRWQ